MDESQKHYAEWKKHTVWLYLYETLGKTNQIYNDLMERIQGTFVG